MSLRVATSVERVGSWREAQRVAPFPIHRPLTPATGISVRRSGEKTWPTVWSMHQFRGATIRLKQLDASPCISSFEPLLSFLAGHRDDDLPGDRLYGPPLTAFTVDGLPACHAGHCYGKEGGAAIAHMCLLDVVVTQGRLRPGGVREFLQGLAWADARLSPARYRQPLPTWAWSLNEQRHMWSWPRAQRWPSRLEWSSESNPIALGEGREIVPPAVPGFEFDSAGRIVGASGGPRHAHLHYRPVRGHAPLSAFYSRGIIASRGHHGALYRIRKARVAGFSARVTRVPCVSAARVDVDLGEVHLTVNVPSFLAKGGTELRYAEPFARALSERPSSRSGA